MHITLLQKNKYAFNAIKVIRHSMDYSDCTIVLPTLNEEKNIGIIIERLMHMYKGIGIIVADDGSTDNTKKEVEKFNGNVSFLDRSMKKVHGLTASVIDGIKHSSRYAIVMDADMQHPLDVVKDIYEKLHENYDIVVACRANAEGLSTFRKLVSKGTMNFAKLVFTIRRKKTVSDMTSGFFGVNVEFFKANAADEKKFVLTGYKVLIDLLRIAPNANVYEIKYTGFSARKYGRSKAKPKIMLKALWSILRP